MNALKSIKCKLGVSKQPKPGYPQPNDPLSADAAELSAANEQDADLSEMNQDLGILAEVFPTVSTHALRNLVTTCSRESRSQLITEDLLSDRLGSTPSRKVHGDFQAVRDVHDNNPSHGRYLHGHERIRSESYKAAVRKALKQEFSGLGRAQLENALAMNNWSYEHTRVTLMNKPQRRPGITGILFWWKARDSTAHSPMIIWPPNESGVSLPTVKRGTQHELAAELEASILAPLRAEQAATQQILDRQYAEQLSEEEAASAQSVYECQCCFVSTAFERMSLCTTDEHFICHGCLRQTVSEAIFGQGWARTVDDQRGTVKCISLSVDRSCNGWISCPQVEAALQVDKPGQQLLQRFQDELTRKALSNFGSGLLQCPTCPYSELATPAKRYPTTFTISGTLILVLCGLVATYGVCAPLPSSSRLSTISSVVAASVTITAFLCLREQSFQVIAKANLMPSLGSSRRTSAQGRKFICRSSTCRAISCLNCLSTWTDPHTCFSTSSQSLRTYVEAAISAAVKRTCPQCRLAFVKASGCNKMMCRCGYSMCYLCKADVTKDTYSHFCSHFRPMGGPCTACERCELYREVDEEKVIAETRRQAEREWWAVQQEEVANKATGGIDLVERMRATVGNDGGLFNRPSRFGGRTMT